MPSRFGRLNITLSQLLETGLIGGWINIYQYNRKSHKLEKVEVVIHDFEWLVNCDDEAEYMNNLYEQIGKERLKTKVMDVCGDHEMHIAIFLKEKE